MRKTNKTKTQQPIEVLWIPYLCGLSAVVALNNCIEKKFQANNFNIKKQIKHTYTNKLMSKQKSLHREKEKKQKVSEARSSFKRVTKCKSQETIHEQNDNINKK